MIHCGCCSLRYRRHRVKSGEPLKTNSAATHRCCTCVEGRDRTVVYWQSRAEASVEREYLHARFLLLPLHPEGRVGKDVVKCVSASVSMAIIGIMCERVSEFEFSESAPFINISDLPKQPMPHHCSLGRIGLASLLSRAASSAIESIPPVPSS